MSIKIEFEVYDPGYIEALEIYAKQMNELRVKKSEKPDWDLNDAAYAFMMKGLEIYLEKHGMDLRWIPQKGCYEIFKIKVAES